MTHPRRAKQGERRPSFLNDVLLFFGAAASFATLLSIFGPTLNLVEQHHSVAKDLRAPPAPALSVPQAKEALNLEADVEDLLHEELFQATIKSCLPIDNAKCKQFVPEPVGHGKKKVQRIAIIAPPGEISNSLRNRVHEILDHQQPNANGLLDIELIETTHVPPYGYGKTHGLTKVLRQVPQPLVLEVTDALQSLLEPGETHAMVTLSDVKAGLRQILRFHCRLSHLAAHTAIMSVGFMDLLSEPGRVVNRLGMFLLDKDTVVEREADSELQFAADDDQESLFHAQEMSGTQILSHIQFTSQVDVNNALDEVLLEELRITKNLTVWPCPSFWTAGEAPDPTKLSPLMQRLARALSPDCTDPYSSCFVKRDKCEAIGDGPCRGM
jgi:hypothetical protein